MTKVLVVDDDSDMRDAIDAILAAAGYESVLASCTREAQNALTAGGIDLVILDIFLNNEDGTEILSGLRQNAAPKTVPVLAISGGGLEGTANLGLTAARARGVSAILYKPFSKEELMMEVSKLI